MSEENKLVEESKDNKPSSGDSKKRSKRCEKPFPPKLRWWQWVFFFVAWFFVLVGLVFTADQLCFKILPPCICCTYIAFGFVLSGLIIDRWIHHELIVHNERLEDISEVEAMFVEARTVERTKKGPMSKPDYFEQKKKELLEEVRRLEKELGNRGWTEYQVLSLNQMLIEFLEVDELKVHARSSLEDLEDYAEDSAYRYDQKQYDKWKDNINKAISEIDQHENNQKEPEKAIEALQAELQMLLEHVASYRENWSKGSAILNGIKICGCLAIALLLCMGLLPIFHPANLNDSDKVLSVLNWGVFGIIGAITAVLLSLRRSDYVEVGNTEGRKELWRTIPGIALGLLAGTLAYWMVAGELFKTGSVVPDLDSPLLKDTGLSVLWAVTSGFYFEKVFDRILSTTMGGNR